MLPELMAITLKLGEDPSWGKKHSNTTTLVIDLTNILIIHFIQLNNQKDKFKLLVKCRPLLYKSQFLIAGFSSTRKSCLDSRLSMLGNLVSLHFFPKIIIWL